MNINTEKTLDLWRIQIYYPEKGWVAAGFPDFNKTEGIVNQLFN